MSKRILFVYRLYRTASLPRSRDPGHDLQQKQSQYTAGDGLADAHRQGIVGEQGGELGGEAASYHAIIAPMMTALQITGGRVAKNLLGIFASTALPAAWPWSRK